MKEEGNLNFSLKDLIIKLKNIYSLIKNNKSLFNLTFCISILIGATFAYFEDPKYIAKLTFTLEEDKGAGASSAIGLASSLGIDLGGSGGNSMLFSSNNLPELMKSELLLKKTLAIVVDSNVKNVTLLNLYLKLNKLEGAFSKFNLKSIKESNREKDSLLKLVCRDLSENYIKIEQKDKKVTIISLEVQSKDEIFSKLFCENLAEETSKFYIETKIKKARVNTEILQKQVDSVKKELYLNLNVSANVTDDVYNLNPAYNIKSVPLKKNQIGITSNTAILTQLVTQLELSKINLRKETPLIQMIDQPYFPLDKFKFGYLKSILISLFLFSLLVLSFIVIKESVKKKIT
jgi:uncharacterized protein involved in exopolysaccharide biosynthesis